MIHNTELSEESHKTEEMREHYWYWERDRVYGGSYTISPIFKIEIFISDTIFEFDK